jgi:hypothetical protein
MYMYDIVPLKFYAKSTFTVIDAYFPSCCPPCGCRRGVESRVIVTNIMIFQNRTIVVSIKTYQ